MSGHQPDRPASVNDNRLSRLHAGEFCGVPAGGENVGQHHVVILFFLRIVREFQTIEVGVGHAQVFGLPAAVRPHAGETVSRAGRSGIGSKTKSSQPRLTIFAEAARNVERQTNPVAHLDPVHGFAHLHDLAEILVAEDSAFLHVGPAFIHVQIRTADVGARNLHQHIGEPFDFRVRHILHPHVAGSVVNQCFHIFDISRKTLRAQWGDLPYISDSCIINTNHLCQNLVYIYSLKEGINDGFLTPFKVKQISTTMDDYVYTSDDTVLEGAVDSGRLYEERDFNRIIEIKAREAYRVSLIMAMIDQREKTIVFCATQLHALAVRDLINQMKTSRDPNYCVRVTANDGARGDQYLREFQDNEKTIPTILTTSQKLSTGVDARNIRNIVLMRPIGSMIEFKQIVGRGTRIYDGKDFFTIYDFVKAHHFFHDPEWDGEPEEVTTPKPGVVIGPTVEPTAHEPPAGVAPPPAKIVVKLADGKERTIQSMVQTTFWDPSGQPMSAVEFLQSLFGALPDFFKSETDLRAIWSIPDTRKARLSGLADKGFGADALWEMQRVIDAENSGMFDVLAYVAFAIQPLTRVKRAADARGQVQLRYTDRQQAFIGFVLDHYTKEGVGELDGDKLAPLLKLRYKNAISDALTDLGSADQIRGLFIGFQRYLYESGATPLSAGG